MNKKIEQIIKELYAQNEDFKKYDKELRDIINKVLESKPDVAINTELKQQIINQLLKKDKIMNFTFKPVYFGLGIAAVAMIVIVSILVSPQLPISNDNLTMVGNRAFGDLSEQWSQPLSAEMDREEISGMGGSMNMLSENSTDMSVQVKMAPDAEPLIYPYNPTRYEYKYVGDDFELIEEDVKVFQRENGLGDDIYGSNIFNDLGISAIDLTAFKNFKVDNIQLSEKKDDGYMIHVDLNRGNISLNRNYNGPWLEASNMISVDDMPSDKTIISISDSFLKKYKVDLSNYGDPIVRKYWERDDWRAEPVREIFSRNMPVLYPLVIDGVTVKEQNGEPHGLNVTVDISNKRVVSLYNLTSHKYDVSMYDAITDKEDVLDIVKKGGIYGGGYHIQEDVNVVVGLVGSPELTLMRQYRYDQSKEYELYVPALMFPVIGWESDEKGYTQNIVVPLVEELINQDYPILYKGAPEPMVDYEVVDMEIEE